MTGIEILILSGVLHLILLFAHGTYIAFAFGISWGTGRRDQPMSNTDLGRRFDRTIVNNTESMTAFLPVMVGSLFVGTTGEPTTIAASVYLVSRVAFAALYLANIPYLRTAAWLGGQVAVVIIAITLLSTLVSG